MEYLSQYRIQTVSNATRVLRALAQNVGPLSCGDIARKTGVEYNRVYRILLTYEMDGVISRVCYQNPDGTSTNPRWCADELDAAFLSPLVA